MPEATIGLAPDSTGAKVHTRARTINAQNVHEQYLLTGREPVVSSRTWVSSMRVRSRAVTLGAAPAQIVFSIWNGGTNLISCRRLSVEADNVIRGNNQASPWLRTYRITTAPTGGVVHAPVPQDTGDAGLSANVAVRADVGTTGTAAAPTAVPNDTGIMPTAVMAVTGLGAVGTAVPMWAQVLPRWITNNGVVNPAPMLLTPDDARLNAEDPMIFRPNQGLAVRFEGPVTATAAWVEGDWTMFFKAVLGEFTYP